MQCTFETLNYCMYLLPENEYAMELSSVITAHNIFAHQCDQHQLTLEEIDTLQDLARHFMQSALAWYESLPPGLATAFGTLVAPKFLNYYEYALEWSEIGDPRLTDTESWEAAGKDWHAGWVYNNKNPETAVIQTFIAESRMCVRVRAPSFVLILFNLS